MDRAVTLVHMPRVTFTKNLLQHVACPATNAPGSTVREVLAAVFADNPRVGGYVLDEQGSLRKHMAVFIDGAQIQDRVHLSDPVPENGEIYIMQALSGGR